MKLNLQTRFDRLLCSLVPNAVLKEYYCRLARKFAEKGIFENNCVVTTTDGFDLHVNKTDGISWRIYFTGYHERTVGQVIKDTLKEGDYFVDVGANIGYFSIMASRCVGTTGKVIAFEASPQTSQMLSKNIELNKCKNIEIHNVAIGKEVGVAKLFSSGAAHLGQKSLLASRGGAVEAEVKCVPLSPQTLNADVSRVRLIKIDVEGAEEYVVAGMEDLLNDPGFTGDIILEISPSEISKSVEEFVSPFTSRGFDLFEIPNNQQLRSYFGEPKPFTWRRVSPKDIHQLCDVLITKRSH